MQSSPMLDATSPINETALIQLRAMHDEDAAQVIDGRMRQLEQIWKRSFAERGCLMVEIKQRLLWQHIDDPSTGMACKSMERYIATVAPQSRSDCYAAMRAVEELTDIPRNELIEMPRANIEVMRSLSSNVRQQPEVLEAAKTMTEKQFTAKIASDFPSQWVESKHIIKLNFSASAGEAVERLIERTMERDGYSTKEEVIEAWGVDYMNGSAV